MQQTPLHDYHRSAGARMAEFGGWDMPIDYGSIIAEHRQCREQVALFDICHMGEFLFTGDPVASGLDAAVTLPVTKIPVGRSKYGFLLNDRGGVIDDLIIFRLADDRFFIVVNAATAANDFAVLSARCRAGSLTDLSAQTGKIDLQGPLAREVLRTHLGPALDELKYFQFRHCSLLGEEVLVSRTGYTGELGYELFISAGKVRQLWDLLLADPRVKPAGLGARDILRLELGYSLYGHELSEDISPLEAGLALFVDFSKEFAGKAALLARQSCLTRGKVAFTSATRRPPRAGQKLFAGDREIGIVTSGSFSPLVGCGFGLGLAATAATNTGTTLHLGTPAGDSLTVVALPFYQKGSVRT
ncbi:MAG TPA: glycine cleavage system aminomethyltransferase GcvT [bacterium]|nr:glycine cleavage system aminomethyltransferase GcvT [bacterium]